LFDTPNAPSAEELQTAKGFGGNQAVALIFRCHIGGELGGRGYRSGVPARRDQGLATLHPI